MVSVFSGSICEIEEAIPSLQLHVQRRRSRAEPLDLCSNPPGGNAAYYRSAYRNGRTHYRDNDFHPWSCTPAEAAKPSSLLTLAS
jgi:hypothetical protein